MIHRGEKLMRKVGLYLHFPFCIQKCRYCDFPSWAGREDKMMPYLDALWREMESWQGRKQDEISVSTIYMGGGTPTLFSGKALTDTLKKCREIFFVEKDAEITIECNPDTVVPDKLQVLAEGGFNRLSMGLQAWQDPHLEFLGRTHGQKQFVNAVKWAEEAGFHNISADLIFGLPGQTPDDWKETLEKTAQTGVQHISAYGLIIEEGTVFHLWQKQGKLQEMEEEQERLLYHEGASLLEELGYRQYEISNFARPGFESRHNLNYWRNGEYLGFGCSAHSYEQSVRWSNISGICEYIEKVSKGESPVVSKEIISRESEVFETLMLGFRLNEGVNKEEFYRRFGFPLTSRYKKEIAELMGQGLIIEDERAVRPTLRGFDFQNRIAMAFLD
jgi:oxygen-independent coproporphyrinogen-3 oxidase